MKPRSATTAVSQQIVFQNLTKPYFVTVVKTNCSTQILKKKIQMPAKTPNLPIIKRLKVIYGHKTDLNLARELGISREYLSQINNKRVKPPHWMILIDYAWRNIRHLSTSDEEGEK